MRSAPLSAGRLLAVTALFFSQRASAFTPGMSSGSYGVPQSIQDSADNTHSSAAYKGRSSGGVGDSGVPVSQSVKSSSYAIWPGYLHRLPTQTPTTTPSRTTTGTSTQSASPTRTATPTMTATRSVTPSPSPTNTPSASPSNTATVTASATATASPSATGTFTRTPTATASPTRSVTPSATPTAYPVLSLAKSANLAVVNAGNTITYTLIGSNSGGADANSFTVWDTLDPSTSFVTSAPAPTTILGNLYVWSFGTFNAGQTGTLVFSVSYTGLGTLPVSNRASANSAQTGQVDSNTVNIGFGAAFTTTDTPTPTASPTSSATSSASPTLTDTGTASQTATQTQTATSTASPSATQTGTPTASPTATASPTETGSNTATPSDSPTTSPTTTATPTFSVSPTNSSTTSPTLTVSPTFSSTFTASSTATPSRTATASLTPSSSPTATLTVTPSVTPSNTPSSSSTRTVTPSFTPTATASRTSTVTPTPQNPSLSLVKNGPSSALLNEVINYSLVVSNSGPGDAASITVDDTLPAEMSFAGPGSLKSFSYGSNDSWRSIGGNLIAIGPFTLPNGQSMTVALQVRCDAGGNTVTNNASAVDTTFGIVGSGSHDTYIGLSIAADTPTSTVSPNYTATPTATQTSTTSPTQSASPSASPTYTGTASSTATFTISPSNTAVSTATPSVTPTFTSTPYAQLSLLKSASVSVVNVAGDRITYVLQVSNPGSADAANTVLWDTVDPHTTYLAGSPAPSLSGNLLSWSIGTLTSGSSQSFTFSVSYSSPGQDVANTGAAAADLVGEVDSNSVNIGFGVAPTATDTQTPTATQTISPTFSATGTPSATASSTPSPSPTQTATRTALPSNTPSPSATPSASPSATPVLSLPPLVLTLVKSAGDPFPGGSPFYYRATVSCPAGPYLTVPDLAFRFDSDTYSLNAFMPIQGCFNPATGQNCNTLNGPASSDVPFRWRLRNVDDSFGVETGTFNIGPSTGPKQSVLILSGVDVTAVGNTITARVIAFSNSLNVSYTATLDTYIIDATPTPVSNIPSPTPVASEGKIVCFPQPAKDKMCFAYHSPQGGKVSIIMYNTAFQVVGRVDDTAQGGSMETSCVDISGMAPGVYFYKAKVGDYAFPMQQFGIAR